MPTRRPEPPDPLPERSFWQLLPKRNLRRALFLVAVLFAVFVLKRSGGLSLSKLLDGVDPVPAPGASTPFRRLQVRTAPAPRKTHVDVEN